jgi:O-methyltransferase
MSPKLRAWIRQVSGAALCTERTLIATYNIAVSVLDNDIPGDFAECGVFAGANVAIMARVLQTAYLTLNVDPRRRRVHIFDSFEGVPAPSAEDVGWTHPAGVSKCGEQYLRERMAEWGVDDSLLVFHPGWFADTVPQFKQPLALLRLDGDLYESTKVCMTHLYPLLSPGGWLICDDYQLVGCRKAVDEAVRLGPVYYCRDANV